MAEILQLDRYMDMKHRFREERMRWACAGYILWSGLLADVHWRLAGRCRDWVKTLSNSSLSVVLSDTEHTILAVRDTLWARPFYHETMDPIQLTATTRREDEEFILQAELVG